jgi:hypothetical protein
VSHLALVLGAALMLSGCSMSLFGGDDAPVTTGSIAPPVQVQQPLPQTLAYSDASKIGQAAVNALWQADKGQAMQPGADWINAATGSSGTVETGAESSGAAEPSTVCRLFNTIVTSIGGVHRYSGKVCRSATGSVVQIEAPEPVAPL